MRGEGTGSCRVLQVECGIRARREFMPGPSLWKRSTRTRYPACLYLEKFKPRAQRRKHAGSLTLEAGLRSEGPGVSVPLNIS